MSYSLQSLVTGRDRAGLSWALSKTVSLRQSPELVAILSLCGASYLIICLADFGMALGGPSRVLGISHHNLRYSLHRLEQAASSV